MLNLLLVEDSEQLRPALSMRLEDTGAVHVRGSCGSGKEALTLCLVGPPDIILMEVQLAGEMNGIEAATRCCPCSSCWLPRGRVCCSTWEISGRAYGAGDRFCVGAPIAPLEVSEVLKDPVPQRHLRLVAQPAGYGPNGNQRRTHGVRMSVP
jgi:hypothetical protein